MRNNKALEERGQMETPLLAVLLEMPAPEHPAVTDAALFRISLVW
jgi:hypothetical protein